MTELIMSAQKLEHFNRDNTIPAKTHAMQHTCMNAPAKTHAMLLTCMNAHRNGAYMDKTRACDANTAYRLQEGQWLLQVDDNFRKKNTQSISLLGIRQTEKKLFVGRDKRSQNSVGKPRGAPTNFRNQRVCIVKPLQAVGNLQGRGCPKRSRNDRVHQPLHHRTPRIALRC